jgi:hypothetical protein
VEFAQRLDVSHGQLIATEPAEYVGESPSNCSSAVEVLVGVPQMVSIAAGAMLVRFVDYRPLLLMEAAVAAAAGAWLLTRAAQSVSASH